MQKLIILRGTPSSGKSTIAKKLRDFEQKIAWLKVDNFKDFFDEDASSALQYVNELAIATLKYLFDQGFSVIMEGVFQDQKYITLATEVAKKKDIQYKVYELECSLKTLLKRDRNRAGVKEGYRKPLGNEVIIHLFNILKENSWEGAEKLNTEQLSLEECVEVVKKELGVD